MHQVIPPINQRSNKQLLIIVSQPDEWLESIVDEAAIELKARNIPDATIDHHIYLAQKKAELERQKIAKEGYTIFDFIFSPLSTWIEILSSWELRKYGYERKADQQVWFRTLFIMFIVMMIVIIS